MGVKFILHNIIFEWDRDKAASNIKKHRVPFEQACEVFFDPFVYHLEDELVNNELRESIIGLTKNWKMLYVVFVIRDNYLRIVSSRSATKLERLKYENQ
jgi:uncharacterized protein